MEYILTYTTGFPTPDDVHAFETDGDPWAYARTWQRRNRRHGYRVVAVYARVPKP